jgi:hypothetical protein
VKGEPMQQTLFDEIQFCMELLHTDSEQDLIDKLTSAGYWGNAQAWRPYGDNPANYSIVGNQQARADAALVEKIVNSVDAVLMGACMKTGVDPESPSAPSDIPSAIKKFISIPGYSPVLTLAATGSRRRPCFTIVDSGEGQRPSEFPNTLLSLSKKNKERIPFVQGKYNMGGSGVLEFCGNNSVQLVISRRDPEIVDSMNEHVPDSAQWGFTVVRRENP